MVFSSEINTDFTSDRSTKQSERFDIRDHLDKLTPAKGKNRYHCPCCGGHNFTYNASDGTKFNCWNGCDRKDIIEILSPWSEYIKRNGRGDRTFGYRRTVSKKQTPAKPAPIPEDEITLARLLEPVVSPKPRQRDKNLETAYPYSNEQWASRIDKPDGEKAVFPYHRDRKGRVKTGKGLKPWLPYRIDEAINYGSERWVLMVEGEKCTEAARQLGLVATTLLGSAWNEPEITKLIEHLKSASVKGLIYFADADQPGQEKAALVSNTAANAEFPCIILNPDTIKSDAPKGWDIADWIDEERANMSEEDFIKKLEQAIHDSVNVRNQEQLDDASEEISDEARLRLEILAYLKETDPIKEVMLKGRICSHYRISSKDLERLCQQLEHQAIAPKQRFFNLQEFLESGTQQLDWLISELLPKGETVVLAALAKTGKTQLATEIAYSVLAGEPLFGEMPVAKGRVLLVSSDESANTTKRRLKARGFDLLNNLGDMRILTHLDINDTSSLEQELEDFRPDLVIIDSLTSITSGSTISEKEAEFAKPIYKLKNLLATYGASGILIHHCNKDKDAKGINKISGSARIAAATWGVWQLVSPEAGNEGNNPTRWLKTVLREGESATHILSFNPRDEWASKGIYEYVGEFGDESGEKRSQGEKVLDLLKGYSPRGLEYREIDEALCIGRSLYTVLDRLEDRRLIEKRRSTTNKRRWVYCLPQHTTNESCTTQSDDSQQWDTPPPALIPKSVELNSESTAIEGIQVSQQLVNINSTPSQHCSTVSQHPENVEAVLNEQNPCTEEGLEVNQQSQQKADERGEGVSVECPNKENVVQEASVSTDNNQPSYQWDELICAIDQELKRLGWTQEQAVAHLKQTYGKRSRLKLTDEQLLEFWSYLEALESGS